MSGRKSAKLLPALQFNSARVAGAFSSVWGLARCGRWLMSTGGANEFSVHGGRPTLAGVVSEEVFLRRIQAGVPVCHHVGLF